MHLTQYKLGEMVEVLVGVIYQLVLISEDVYYYSKVTDFPSDQIITATAGDGQYGKQAK